MEQIESESSRAACTPLNETIRLQVSQMCWTSFRQFCDERRINPDQLINLWTFDVPTRPNSPLSSGNNIDLGVVPMGDVVMNYIDECGGSVESGLDFDVELEASRVRVKTVVKRRKLNRKCKKRYFVVGNRRQLRRKCKNM